MLEETPLPLGSSYNRNERLWTIFEQLDSKAEFL